MYVIKYLLCYVFFVGMFVIILKIINGEIFFFFNFCVKLFCWFFGVVLKYKYLGKNVILIEFCEYMFCVSDDVGNWFYLVFEFFLR